MLVVLAVVKYLYYIMLTHIGVPIVIIVGVIIDTNIVPIINNNIGAITTAGA